MELRWFDARFCELLPRQLYAIVQLRQRVFVVEQNCPYLDADGLDVVSRHVWAEAASGLIRAYLRIVPPGAKYPEVSIGRVVTSTDARGCGLGRMLMSRALELAGAAPIRIAAQAHLQRFYRDFGFTSVGEVYEEDGIPHVEMFRA